MSIDDLREQAGAATPFDDDDELIFDDDFDDFDDFDDDPRPRRIGGGGNLLGLSPFQRFFLSFMLLLLSCMLSFVCLLLTGRILI